MKKILYTQRVEIVEGYKERRDCADQNIPRFLYACSLMPIPIMNISSIAIQMNKEISVDGIFLTGGNDLKAYGGDAPERDETERVLLEYALAHKIPVIGICRGMQLIADYYGSQLVMVDNHVGRKHPIHGIIERDAVNSFHGMGIRDVKAPLNIYARSDDGIVEAIQHRSKAVAGIMWHPERVNGFSKKDIQLISKFFNGEGLA